jgi:hypothetical protein
MGLPAAEMASAALAHAGLGAMPMADVSLGAASSGGVTCIVFGVIAAALAGWAAWRGAVNEAQRRFYKRIFTIGGLLVISVGSAALLSNTGILPAWTTGTAVAVWFAIGIPGLIWINQHLRELAGR